MRDMKSRCYRFENVEIDVQNLRVTVGSEIRPLEPKSFRLLLFLIENPGRALPKEEIMAVVWPDTFVSDNSLARAITQIRKALDDDPKSPRYIETVPAVGYRFIGRIREEEIQAEVGTSVNSVPGVAAPSGSERTVRLLPAAIGLGLVLAAGVGIWWTQAKRSVSIPY